ncbi:sulfurtransferase [Lampropedia cohaerens]|uniref:Sulfurtransferase n=1 Tax=Lampropedia cohaerens TaxID=1610491 RepID=A0A0U1Q0B4_9BURK|nr:rhodanese-like domain-containing protein [Lampropedia cohaerens]KKW68176.1 sulfurtransferase [Lampropedia cohaerens]
MIEQITPAGFPDWVAKNQTGDSRPLLIDVREPWEWTLASVKPDAAFELLQLSMGDIPAALNQLDPDRPTALLCHHGMRSQSVAQFLLANGFEHLANVTGGIDAWSTSVDPSIARY